MGRQLEEDDDDWELLSDDALKELSPLLDTRKQSRFQRLDRQRAAYFADLEENQNIGAVYGDVDDSEYNRSRESSADEEDKSGNESGEGEDRLPASGFADLSTWYCDALVPAHSHFVPLAGQLVRSVSIADQPTMVLSSLPSSSIHRADLPTLPILPAADIAGVSHDLSSDGPLLPVKEKTRGTPVRFCWRFLYAWLHRVRRVMRSRKLRQPASKGRELLMERRRERQQRETLPRRLPTPADGRNSRQFRRPVDGLFS